MIYTKYKAELWFEKCGKGHRSTLEWLEENVSLMWGGIVDRQNGFQEFFGDLAHGKWLVCELSCVFLCPLI